MYPDWGNRYLVYSLLASGSVILHGIRMVTERSRWGSASLKESHFISLGQTMHVAVLLSIFLVATKDKAISRLFLFTWLIALYFLLLTFNRCLPRLIARSLYKNRTERVLLIGPAQPAPMMTAWLEYQRSLGVEFINLQPNFSISSLTRLEEMLKEQAVTRVILTEIPEEKYNLQYVVELCERLGVRLLVVSNFEPIFRHKATILEDSGLQFIGLREEPLDSPFNRVIKRLLDFLVSVPVVAFILPPIALLTWFMQRIQSPGPVLYKQPRAGLQNQIFGIFKFRTMHLGNPNIALQAQDGDDRIYPFGRWLRRTSLDELPQFINVLRGEMSLVGPRPHLIEHNERFARVMKNYYVRSTVKPGISGLAQVRGFRGEAKTDQDIIKRIESDIAYLESWTISLDLIILARTALQVLFPPRTAR